MNPRNVITAPLSGVVMGLGAREGMTVTSGAQLFSINGLATVWVNAELAENVAATVRPGDPVEARSAALPDTVFKGKVGAVLPDVSAATRTLKARIELANTDGRLVTGMFATIRAAGCVCSLFRISRRCRWPTECNEGRMRPPGYYKRVVDVMEELFKMTLLLLRRADYLTYRYSGRNERAVHSIDAQIEENSSDRRNVRLGYKSGWSSLPKMHVSGNLLSAKVEFDCPRRLPPIQS